MNISWDLIRTFQSVANTGSLSAAARQLKLTQPTVGRHIDLLEDRLGISLFVRTREGMSLTEKGTDLIDAAGEMLQAANGFELLATGLEEKPAGIVRISANEIFGVLVLPNILAEFMDQNPHIEIELVVSNSAANLLQRDADIAVRMFRPTQNDLQARKITELPVGFFAHQNYLSANGKPSFLSDLLEHRLIGFDRDMSMISAAESMGEVLKPENFAFRSDNILAHIEAIRAGVGIGVTHIGLAHRWEGVERVLPDLVLPGLELWIACHSEVRHNKRIRAVMDFLAQNLKHPYAML